MGAVFRKHPTQEQPVPKAQVATAHPAQGFDPRHFSARCLVWCRADAGVDRNGSTASRWRDMSGNGNDFSQSTAVKQPALASAGLGGRPELTFDGSNDTMDGASFYGMVSAADDWTVVVVCRDWTWGPMASPHGEYLVYGRGVLGAPSGGGSYFEVAVTNEAGPGLGFAFNDGSHRYGYGVDAEAEGASVVMIGTCDSGDITGRFNGASGSPGVGGGSGLNSSATTLELGGGNVNLYRWDGAVSEVILFDGVLEDHEIAALENYLMTRYGIH